MSNVFFSSEAESASTIPIIAVAYSLLHRAAYLAAASYSNRSEVQGTLLRVNFLQALDESHSLEAVGVVVDVNNNRLYAQIDLYASDRPNAKVRNLLAQGHYRLEAFDQNGKPADVPIRLPASPVSLHWAGVPFNGQLEKGRTVH